MDNTVDTDMTQSGSLVSDIDLQVMSPNHSAQIPQAALPGCPGVREGVQGSRVSGGEGGAGRPGAVMQGYPTTPNGCWVYENNTIPSGKAPGPRRYCVF